MSGVADTVVAVQSRIRGLDTLRFLAAVWVAVGHGATFPIRYVASGIAPGLDLPNSIDGIFFNGSAAVIFFFLISGFCIHHPNLGVDRFDPLPFLVRRFVRIGIPLLIVVAFIEIVGGEIGAAGQRVLWTIYCELAYYALYPVLRVAMARFGTLKLTVAAFVAAFTLALFHLEKMYAWDFGVNVWIIGLSAWLLGCLLAEHARDGRLTAKPGRIAYWRIGGLVLSTAALLMIFHGPLRLGFPITLNLFSIYAFFWIKAELARYAIKPPLAAFEFAGLWGYSLYLIHNMVIAALEPQRLTTNPILFWLCQVAGILLCSYVFYLVIERPSHLLARRWSHQLRRARAVWS